MKSNKVKWCNYSLEDRKLLLEWIWKYPSHKKLFEDDDDEDEKEEDSSIHFQLSINKTINKWIKKTKRNLFKC